MFFEYPFNRDDLEVFPPDALGVSVVLYKGRVVVQVFFSEIDGTATLGNGHVLTPQGFLGHIAERIQTIKSKADEI
jgi:hypothetical protein